MAILTHEGASVDSVDRLWPDWKKNEKAEIVTDPEEVQQVLNDPEVEVEWVASPDTPSIDEVERLLRAATFSMSGAEVGALPGEPSG